ncbi:hypothetical protein NLZ15_22695 (plasmid) [Atlantibacter subterranea]|uniref:hypothetical protein n=1 Tax=Atlantibacter subterraneus TaxID=255519 RepID=UPI0020C3C8AF|nr:hypothetical protein [Atlantibacter subterranea]UTJ49784.1 hypothetical protein NLZ15_22695 [Atlantibacter subterranea]
MDWLPSLLPITVVAAIALFALKEVLEFIRRRSADRRKSHAFRTLLARECEVNHWAHWRLQETLREIHEDHEKGVKATYTATELPGGDALWRRTDQGGGYSGGGLPDARTDLISKIMVDVATMDKKLFTPLENAYDSLIEMRHIRASLLRFVSSKDEEDQMHLQGFPEYGLSELEGVKEDLDKLYLECTGRSIDRTDMRVRG